jgi:hypothetical protein
MPIVTNDDGLTIKLGVSEGQSGVAGEYEDTVGGSRVIAFAVDLVDVGSSAAVFDENCIFDKNLLIEKVEVETTTAVTGSGATLNIGLQKTDHSTELDYDGLGKAAALTQTAMATKGTILTYVTGTSNAGALIGTQLAENGLLTLDYDTAAFTDGRITVRVYVSVPL